MSSTVIGMLLAFGAAIALNGGYLMQHVGASSASAVDVRRPVATVVSLLRSPLWTLGALFGITGWLLHIAAMREAPLSLVQACVSGGLVFVAPMAAIGLRRRLARDETQAIVLMAIALVLLSVGLTAAADAAADPDELALALCMGVLIVAAVVLALRVSGVNRSFALGVAAGLLYGAADMGLKAVTGLHGVTSILASPWLAVALAATAGAFFAFQRGLQGTRPLAVIAVMTAAANVSSILGAFVVFGDPLGKTPGLAALHGLAFALVVVAAWRLAPAQARLAGVHA